MCAFVLGGASGPDPGILLELDREHFALAARDLRDGADGPALRVALGSPAHPTPAGEFPLHRVLRNPAWKPGTEARARGARPIPASTDGPLGAAKIPFEPVEGIALHGGADPRLVGKPVSLGCVRATDAGLLALLAWLETRDALSAEVALATGERRQRFVRPARLVVE